MIEPKDDRPYSDDPYSDLPYDGGSHGGRKARKGPEEQGPLCAEAQADGVPCYELGRDCETCERAFLSWAEGRSKQP